MERLSSLMNDMNGEGSYRTREAGDPDLIAVVDDFEEAVELAKDVYWDAYLKREWEERNDEFGFRCDFTRKALYMHGPCKVYRPIISIERLLLGENADDLQLVDVLDPVTRRSVK